MGERACTTEQGTSRLHEMATGPQIISVPSVALSPAPKASQKGPQHPPGSLHSPGTE